jgi:hypothetical protein
MKDGYAVTVTQWGDQVVTIEETALSGRELSDEDCEAIREAARHLMSFVGDGTPTPCFLCGARYPEPCRDDCEVGARKETA